MCTNAVCRLTLSNALKPLVPNSSSIRVYGGSRYSLKSSNSTKVGVNEGDDNDGSHECSEDGTTTNKSVIFHSFRDSSSSRVYNVSSSRVYDGTRDGSNSSNSTKVQLVCGTFDTVRLHTALAHRI